MPLPTPANTTHPRAKGYGALIGDLYVRLAHGPGRELQIETAPLQAPSIDTRQNPEELNDEFGQTFGRDDFTGGEGVDQAHEREPKVNASRRYYDSWNIDVSAPKVGQTREIRLLKSTATIDTTLTAFPRLAWNGTNLFATGGGTTIRVGSSLDATPSFATEDPHAGEGATTCDSVAVLGSEVYAALGANGIHRRVSGVWSHWNDVACTRVWASKNRIFARFNNNFYEVASSGAAPSPLYTVPSGHFITDVADAGAAVLTTSTDGYIYAFAPDDLGALELKAQTLIEGEFVYTVCGTQGKVFYGTVETIGSAYTGRLWMADLADDFTLTNAQLLKEWPADGQYRWPGQIVVHGKSVYTVVKEDDAETHVWRYDLAEAALSRHWVFSHPGAATDGMVFGMEFAHGRLHVGVSGVGVARVTDAYVDSGWLIGPIGDFFSASIKSWVGARLDTSEFGGGAQVDLSYTTNPEDLTDADSAGWTVVKTTTTGGDDTETPISGVTARSIAGKVTLTASTDNTATPAVRSFSFRAYPGGSGNVDKVVSLPVNVSDQLESPNRRVRTVKGWGQQVYAALRDYEGQAVELSLLRPELNLRGLVESVGAPLPGQPERGSPTLYAMVRFRGHEVTEGDVEADPLYYGGDY